jgi:hypothetical protein
MGRMVRYMFETRPFQSCLIKFGSVISEQNLKMWKANENGHTPVTPSNGKRSYSPGTPVSSNDKSDPPMI